ncbi:MAG: hypothetical protein RLZZ397_1356 [Pseudomonadota bacterium]
MMNIECFHFTESSMVNHGVPTSIKVLLRHPEKIFLEALTESLPTRDDLQIIPMLNNAGCMHQELMQHKPDVVVFGMHHIAPQLIEDLHTLSAASASTSLVVFSNLHDAGQIRSVFDAGVRGCVSASAGLSELVCAIRTTFEGRLYMCADSLQRMLHASGSDVDHQSAESSLGDREGQVLRLIADGYTSKQIARSLNIAPGTVDVHRRNIMRKVGVHKVAELTKYAIRHQMVGV